MIGKCLVSTESPLIIPCRSYKTDILFNAIRSNCILAASDSATTITLIEMMIGIFTPDRETWSSNLWRHVVRKEVMAGDSDSDYDRTLLVVMSVRSPTRTLDIRAPT